MASISVDMELVGLKSFRVLESTVRRIYAIEMTILSLCVYICVFVCMCGMCACVEQTVKLFILQNTVEMCNFSMAADTSI